MPQAVRALNAPHVLACFSRGVTSARSPRATLSPPHAETGRARQTSNCRTVSRDFSRRSGWREVRLARMRESRLCKVYVKQVIHLKQSTCLLRPTSCAVRSGFGGYVVCGVFHSDFRGVFHRSCVKRNSPSRMTCGSLDVKSTTVEALASSGPISRIAATFFLMFSSTDFML